MRPVNMKKKQDEKHYQMLRSLASLAHNKTCFDCGQKGPTYINMTIGSFVCTACSGILRGLNPPQRCKSISMTSFTVDEMDFIMSRGNEFCRQSFMAHYDSRKLPSTDFKDDQKKRDFLSEKYERRRWYQAPTQNMLTEARKMNEAALVPPTKTTKTLGGGGVPQLKLGPPPQSSARPHPSGHAAHQQPPPVQVPPPITSPPATVSLPSANSSNLLGPSPPSSAGPVGSLNAQPTSQQSGGGGAAGLLSDLGGDIFGAPTAPAAATTGGGGFADFGNFGAATTGGAANSTPASQPDFFGGSAPLTAAAPAQAPAAPTASAPIPFPPASTSNQDRYAALADLDTIFTTNTPPKPTPPVQWGGGASTASDSGALQWASTPAQPANPAPSGGLWGAPAAPPPTSTMFGGGGAVANPFGGAAGTANPFVATPQPAAGGGGAGAGFANFSNGGSQPQAQLGGFGAQPNAMGGGGNMFGATNGASGGGQGWGFGAPQQQAAGWGQAGQPNPFMNNAAQPAAAPKSNSTNPFL